MIADGFTGQECRKKVVQLAASGDIDWIHLRDHAADRRRFASSGRMLCTAIRTKSRSTQISINTDLDLARKMETGLHVGIRGPSPVSARSELGPDALIGYSIHEESDVTDLIIESVDYLMLGPVFDPISKDGVSGTGLGLLTRIARMTTLPVFAVGGITPGRTGACLEAGAYGVATIGGVMNSANPSSALHEFRMAV